MIAVLMDDPPNAFVAVQVYVIESLIQTGDINNVPSWNFDSLHDELCIITMTGCVEGCVQCGNFVSLYITYSPISVL